jgi:hypothetical protein
MSVRLFGIQELVQFGLAGTNRQLIRDELEGDGPAQRSELLGLQIEHYSLLNATAWNHTYVIDRPGKEGLREDGLKRPAILKEIREQVYRELELNACELLSLAGFMLYHLVSNDGRDWSERLVSDWVVETICCALGATAFLQDDMFWGQPRSETEAHHFAQFALAEVWGPRNTARPDQIRKDVFGLMGAAGCINAEFNAARSTIARGPRRHTCVDYYASVADRLRERLLRRAPADLEHYQTILESLRVVFDNAVEMGASGEELLKVER